MGAMKNAYRIVVGKSEGKRTLRRFRLKFKDNIKMDLEIIGCDNEDSIQVFSIGSINELLYNKVTKLRVPHKIGNFLTS